MMMMMMMMMMMLWPSAVAGLARRALDIYIYIYIYIHMKTYKEDVNIAQDAKLGGILPWGVFFHHVTTYRMIGKKSET